MSDHQITLTVDGDREQLTVEGRTLLVHALREGLGVTVPKVGCETGKCGACTVELDGDVHASSEYRATVLPTYVERAVLAAVDDGRTGSDDAPDSSGGSRADNRGDESR